MTPTAARTDHPLDRKEDRGTTVRAQFLRAAFTQPEASAYLGLEPGSRWLDDAPVPRVDMRKPGASRPVWRWRKVDLDEFLASRVVRPGEPNPQDLR